MTADDYAGIEKMLVYQSEYYLILNGAANEIKGEIVTQSAKRRLGAHREAR